MSRVCSNPECGQPMAVVQSYACESADAHTRRLICKSCGRTAVEVSFVLQEDPPRGRGARGLAQSLTPGQVEAARRALKNPGR